MKSSPALPRSATKTCVDATTYTVEPSAAAAPIATGSGSDSGSGVTRTAPFSTVSRKASSNTFVPSVPPAQKMPFDVSQLTPSATGCGSSPTFVQVPSGARTAMSVRYVLTPSTKSLPPATRNEPSGRKPANGRATFTGAASGDFHSTAIGVAALPTNPATAARIATVSFFIFFSLSMDGCAPGDYFLLKNSATTSARGTVTKLIVA